MRIAPEDGHGRPAAARPVWWQQLAIGLALFALYVLVDSLASPSRRAAAMDHGRDLLAWEQHLHLDIEHGLNHALAPHRVFATLASYEYAWTYILSALALLGWVWWRRPEVWRDARDSFIVMNLAAFVCFALYPVAPPRFLTDAGFIDVVRQGHTAGSWGNSLVDSANQVAAIPSLHVGWALWVSAVLARLALGRWVQLISAVHVLLTWYVVMATANHYLVDALAAVPAVLLGEAYARWRVWRRDRRPRGELVPACDAFFLNVEGAGAPQHVGGVVLLEPSEQQPTIEQVRDLVRHGLARRPGLDLRPVQPSRWRRLRWITADDIDLDWHVVERRAEGGIEGLVAELAQDPMPRDRPLWRVVLVRDIAPGVAGVICVVHHSVADGIRTVDHTFALFEPQVSMPMPSGGGPGPLVRAAATVAGLAQLATDGGARPLGEGSRRRSYATADVHLAELSRAASARDVRVTDLLIAATVAGLRATAPQLVARAGRRLCVSVPLAVPTTRRTGNATAAVMVKVPLDEPDLERLIVRIARLTQRLRRPTRAIAARFVMATGLRLLPEPAAAWFARTVYGPRFLQVIVSNIPGPRPQLSLLGTPVHRAHPILPLAPQTPLALGALGWSGELGLGMAGDPAMLDVDALSAHVGDTLAGLAGERSVGMPLQREEEARP